MGEAVILPAAAMGGAVAATAGVVVTDAVGTVEGMGGVGMVEGTGVVGMVVVGIGAAVVPIGGGVTPTPMLTDLTVGKRTVGMSSRLRKAHVAAKSLGCQTSQQGRAIA
jgi:hypothetical protein